MKKKSKKYYLQNIAPFNEIKFHEWSKDNPDYSGHMDCAIRAVSVLFNISWEETYKELFKLSLENKTVYNDREKVLDPIFNKYGYKYDDSITGNVATFIASNMDKDYAIVINRHIFVVKHGCIYDRCRYERSKNKLLSSDILGIYIKKYTRYKGLI